jgi:hypothetical protein
MNKERKRIDYTIVHGLEFDSSPNDLIMRIKISHRVVHSLLKNEKVLNTKLSYHLDSRNSARSKHNTTGFDCNNPYP